MFNPGPRHQLAHYAAAFNLSLSSFQNPGSVCSSPWVSGFLSFLAKHPLGVIYHHLFNNSFFLLQPLPRRHNSIVPALPAGCDGINKAGFEIDFLSAPFWIALLLSFWTLSILLPVAFDNLIYIHSVSVVLKDCSRNSRRCCSALISAAAGGSDALWLCLDQYEISCFTEQCV